MHEHTGCVHLCHVCILIGSLVHASGVLVVIDMISMRYINVYMYVMIKTKEK